MSQCVRRLQVHEVRDGRQCLVELVVSQLAAHGWRFAHHCVPRRHLLQLREDRPGLGLEQLYEGRVELPPAAGAGNFDGSLDPAGVVEHLGDIGQVDQAGRRQYLLALRAVGLPLAVPALEGLGDAVPDGI